MLITGSTGYIGSYTSRMLAATNPKTTVYALSRASADVNKVNHPKMTRFENIVFVEGDCLDTDRLPSDELLAECDSVIHMVGAITDSFDYKRVLQLTKDPERIQRCVQDKLKDPTQLLQTKTVLDAASWVQGLGEVEKSQSLEAQNRDSAKNMAFKFNQICGDQGRVGTFVFLSAEASIVGGQQQRRYADMKLEAEEFLIN